MNIHRFSVDVSCSLPNDNEESGSFYKDNCFLAFPDSYSDDGEATRLVISCHGAGGTVTTDDAQVEGQIMTAYLLANGYAVMDTNGLPEAYALEKGIDLRNNIGSPIAIRCYLEAYSYCMEHFNLKREVFVHGGSMGGISSTNLVLSGLIPVIAHTCLCPVLDTYNQIFLHPWSGGLPKTALGKIYALDVDENGEYIYDEDKILGFNPVENPKSSFYPVPVKFWHCKDDGTVSYSVTEKFIERIQRNGGIACLRSFEYGAHEPQLVGDPVEAPSGTVSYNGTTLKITPAIEEVFAWIRKYDR